MISWQTVYLDTVDSTNNELKRRADAGAPEGLVVIAGRQTSGRGRQGRSFQSPAGKGLYLSALLRPETVPAEAAALTAWTAVAVCDGIEAACSLRPGIKWTNDLIVNGRKLCGILVEGRTDGQRLRYLAVGIGINVGHAPEDFEPPIRSTAVSLSMALGKPVDSAGLTVHLLQALDRMRADFPARKAEWLSRYRQNCLTVGRRVMLLRGEEMRDAFAEGIGDDFGLIVRYPDGRRETVTSGEVSVRGMLGYV